MRSPYNGKPETDWAEITRRLLERHPLKEDVIRAVALTAWETLWRTTLGEGAVAVLLRELEVPATVVGYFFEVLFARELARRFPGTWRGNQNKDEKDLVHIPDAAYSVEMKTSGQLGVKVYGNRSYGQQVQDPALAKKEKSGYYITVNFFEQTLRARASII